MTQNSPLADVTVVTIENWMAAPSASAILSDLGARVIKVEPLTGDPMRGNSRPVKRDDLSDELRAYDFSFDVDNRGKESIAVALDTEAGTKIVHDLVARADVFMCNLLIPRQQKFSMDPESLFNVKPDLVHATFTGYGTTGPDAGRPGYDVTAFFGRSGLYDAMREGEDGVVPMARPAQGDHSSGLALVASILAALRMVEKTGEGQTVETSLYETAVWTQATDYAVTAMDKAPVRHRARNQMLAITANRFPCGDGKWVVFNMLPESAYWGRLCQAIDAEELLEDERFADASLRYRNMAELVALVDTALAKRTRDEWGPIFDKAGLIWGPVLQLHEVPQDPQAQALGLFPIVEHPDHGSYTTVAAPMRFGQADVRPRGPAPALGAHTAQILEELGYDESSIQNFLADATIGGADPS